ncbi:LuxR C-terminal-related transcriptional regulator [Streptomyces sp. NPDC012751]|uniref:helix-turn-helix transcriptional regulator n=1 Tax=Streptomyces sp. NPDC012751 TaxID=3364846 RepID=UPI0036C60A01
MPVAGRDLCSAPFGGTLRQTEWRSGVLVLQGGPGTGKTFLLEEMKRRAVSSGSLCLRATGFREEREISFSVLEQFIHVPGIPDRLRSAVGRLVRGAAPGTSSDAAPAPLLRDLVSALVAAGGRTGVVILVDDAQYLDPASQSCLLYLARRAQSHDITLVVAYPRTVCDGSRDYLEFVGLPGARLIEATGLCQEEVERLLERRVGAEAATRLAAPVHRISGGNPALATALVRDLLLAGTVPSTTPPSCERSASSTPRTPTPAQPPTLAPAPTSAPPPAPVPPTTSVPVGDAFRTAYLAALVRHPCLARIVQALAVLGADASPVRAAQLLERSTEETEQHISELECAGLLEDGGFRHPAIPAAVLGMLGAEGPGLHRRAAALLFADGAPALAVARHLVAADEPPDPSQARVLRHAWQQLLKAGQTDRALACLRLADRADLGAAQRSKVLAALIATLSCVNPLAAEPEAGRLLAAARAGQADCEALRVLVLWFLWFGFRDQAREVMTRLVESCEPSHAHDEPRGFHALIGCLWPQSLDDPAVRGYFRGTRDVTATARYGTPVTPLPRAGSARPGGPRRIPPPVTAPDADDNDAVERRPAPAVPEARRFREPDLAAVLELMREGETTLADRLCEEQRDRLPAHELPARRAFLTGLSAHIRWQLGDLRTAAAHAADALALLPDHSWGVAVGLPLSVLIAAHSLMGDPDQAARYLERPVPDELWDSSFGPLYRVARGCHLLEVGRPHAALNDFTACAPPAGTQHANALGPLGWRAYAAEAHLALGEPDRARRMAVAELMQGDRETDAHGRALQVLAVVDEPERRRNHLQEAERTLRTAGSRLSLAGVLAQLSQVDLADGHTRTARVRWNEALSLAAECGAPHRLRQLATPLDEPPAPAEPFRAEDGRPARTGPPPTAADGGLTEAEWRVASLAAAGRSNRQIATRLYITVSTVEQHLTRVYRKLSVRRRSELSGLLGPRCQEGDPARDDGERRDAAARRTRTVGTPASGAAP